MPVETPMTCDPFGGIHGGTKLSVLDLLCSVKITACDKAENFAGPARRVGTKGKEWGAIETVKTTRPQDR